MQKRHQSRIRLSDDRSEELSESVLLLESSNPAGCIDDLLLACIEWMTDRTDFDVQILLQSGTRLETIPTDAGYLDGRVFRVNALFHGLDNLLYFFGD